MERAGVRADFSGALSAIVVVALIVATTAVMLVTLNSARATGEIAGEAKPAVSLISLSSLTK
jgi:hypothetical protein